MGNLIEIRITRKFYPGRDGVSNPELFKTPQSEWVIGVSVSPTYVIPNVWESIDAARKHAEIEGAEFHCPPRMLEQVRTVSKPELKLIDGGKREG